MPRTNPALDQALMDYSPSVVEVREDFVTHLPQPGPLGSMRPFWTAPP